MYSRNYGYVGNDKDREQVDIQTFGPDTAEHKREKIPVETFHDKIGEAEFQRMYSTPPFQQEPFAIPEAPMARMEEEPDRSCSTGPSNQKKNESKGMFGFLDGFMDGFFKNIGLDDIIIVALIFLFMKDDDKSNDYMMPILLFILLAF